MKNGLRVRFIGILALIASVGVGVCETEIAAVTYTPHVAHSSCHMNLGPTGAKAWMRGYDLVVVSLDEGSPADGVLKLGDAIVSANGIRFGAENDPRITMGHAIEEAESSGEPLKLRVIRKNRKRTIRLPLPQLGAFAESWPYDCAKSEKILTSACRSVETVQMPTGRIPTDGNIGTSTAGLLLLGSANPRFLDAARRAAYSVKPPEADAARKNNWVMGYESLLLAEYYLATGDDSVLPALRTLVQYLSEGQMRCGTWGHSSPSGAYGGMNQAGVIDTIALALAKECGVKVDPVVFKKAVDFFSRYAELGAVPYGDHLPGARQLDSNGRSSSSGVLMQLLGEKKEAAAFVDAVAQSYWMREAGHTGGFFSMIWGPLCADWAEREAFHRFMNYQKWYYCLNRTWKGGLTLLPYHEALTRFDSSTYINFGGDFTTGGLGLVYALPHKHLRILGAPRSVFSAGLKMSKRLSKARAHYLKREWAACDGILADLNAADLSSEEERYWFRQLTDARRMLTESVDLTLLKVESYFMEQAPYVAKCLYEALKEATGDVEDERFEKVETRIAAKSWHIGEGKEFYDRWGAVRDFKVRSWVPQGVQAARLLETLPSLYKPLLEPLSPVSDTGARTWHSLTPEKGDAFPRGWERVGFDDSEWQVSEGISTGTDRDRPILARRTFTVDDPSGEKLIVRLRTVRPARTKVFLNGMLVVDAVRGRRGGYARIELDESALDLLKPGKNLLAVKSNKQGQGNNKLDVGLYINRIPLDQRTREIWRADLLRLGEISGVDFAMRVRETKDAYMQALREAYAAKSADDLVSTLSDPVGFVRYMGESALAERGVAALSSVTPLLSSKEWKERSSACNVIARVASMASKAEDTELQAAAFKTLSEVSRLLDDSNEWTRVCAVKALGAMGPAAAPALDRLVRKCGDESEWVRINAVRAARSVSEIPGPSLEAAKRVIMQENTSFGALRPALKAFQENPVEKDDGRLAALAQMLSHPPEGMGGRTLLKPYFELAVSLDPDGDVMIPILIDGAADKTELSRQQANPRKVVIELLGGYGKRAKAAVPVLKQIIESELKKEGSLKDPAREAIEKIQG